MPAGRSCSPWPAEPRQRAGPGAGPDLSDRAPGRRGQSAAGAGRDLALGSPSQLSSRPGHRQMQDTLCILSSTKVSDTVNAALRT
jgi:hypothetical protein